MSLRQQFGPNPSDAAIHEAFTRPPEIIEEITGYLDSVASQWVLDPTGVKLPRTGRFSSAVGEAAVTLAECENGSNMVPIFHHNLEVLVAHCQTDEIDEKVLTVRPGHDLPPDIELRGIRECERHRYSNHDSIREEVTDVKQLGAMTTALKAATNAKVIRDDFESDESSLGVRVFKGAVRGIPVYFSEVIAPNPFGPQDDEGVLERMLFAETQVSLKDTLHGLSDLDLELLERANVSLPVVESSVDLLPEKPSRQRMIGVLRLYEMMARDSHPTINS